MHHLGEFDKSLAQKHITDDMVKYMLAQDEFQDDPMTMTPPHVAQPLAAATVRSQGWSSSMMFSSPPPPQVGINGGAQGTIWKLEICRYQSSGARTCRASAL